MSIDNASLFEGAPVAPSGGTALPFGPLGASKGVNTIYATDDTDLRSRREIVFTTKEPKVSASAPAGYTQARAVAVFKSPLELDNGNSTVNTVRIEVAYDAETSTAEKTELMAMAAQICSDADFTAFFHNLSLA